MKIVKLYIFDISTSCHHGRLVVNAATWEVVEAFLAKDFPCGGGDDGSIPICARYSDYLAHELTLRLVSLYKMQPTRVAYVPDYILDEDEDEDGNAIYWRNEAIRVCKFHRGL